MKKLILLLTVLFGAVNMSAQDNDIQEEEVLVKVEKDGKYGFVDKSGKVVIPFIYDWANDFKDGLAMVVKDGKDADSNNEYGFVDKSGKVVIPLIYDGAGNFKDGLAKVSKSGKYGFIDKSGKAVIPLIYDDVLDYDDVVDEIHEKDDNDRAYFEEGLLKVRKDDKCGLIDRSGKVVIPIIYDDIYNSAKRFYFNDGLAKVSKDGKCGLIDKSGNLVVPCIYAGIKDFMDGLAIVWVSKDDSKLRLYIQKYGLIDKSGKVVVPLIYDDMFIKDIERGLLNVRKDGKSYVIDKSGKVVTQ